MDEINIKKITAFLRKRTHSNGINLMNYNRVKSFYLRRQHIKLVNIHDVSKRKCPWRYCLIPARPKKDPIASCCQARIVL